MSAKTEVPMNDAGRDRDDHRGRRRTGVLPHPPGEVPDHDEGERPAAGDVVGRRGEVEQQAGDEADDGGERRTADERGGDHDQQAEVGDDALPREVGEHRDLEHQRDQDQTAGDAPARADLTGGSRRPR